MRGIAKRLATVTSKSPHIQTGFTKRSERKMVELSGYRPPSPGRLTGAFSRLSLDFILFARTPRSVAYRALQILYLARPSNRAFVPARLCDRRAEWFGPTLCVR